MSDDQEAPRHPVRDVEGRIMPGTQPHGPQVVERSSFAALPTTPFTPDPALVGPQRPLQPGDGPKQALDANQPPYANPQASGAWVGRRPPSEKVRVEREMAGFDDTDPRFAGADNAPDPNVVQDVPVHDMPVGHDDPGAPPQETDEARRLREEQERLQREREDAERQEAERRQQEQHQGEQPQS